MPVNASSSTLLPSLSHNFTTSTWMSRLIRALWLDKWHHVMINWQLSAVISYPLTSTTWPYRGLEFIARRGHMFIKVDRWPSIGFRLDRGLMWGKIVENRGWGVRKPVNSNPGLKVNQIITVSSLRILFCRFCFVYQFCDY